MYIHQGICGQYTISCRITRSDMRYILACQTIIRCYLMRKKYKKYKHDQEMIIENDQVLPAILIYVRKYLLSCNIKCYNKFKDGRHNSYNDENTIINKLEQNTSLMGRIYYPDIRMWYDILLLDDKYGWIPVNIKSTTTKSCDNIGNLAVCCYSYTNEKMKFDRMYNNGDMAKVLYDKLNKYEYNDNKRDYYFIVINKNKPNDIIINSVLGLSKLSPNINNLPFQIKWDDNREYKYTNIEDKINLFIDCIKKSNNSWREHFINNIQSLSYY